MKVNWQLSDELAQETKPIVKQCYKNALMAMASSIVDDGATYVEGYVTLPTLGGMAVEHGWFEYKGEIVDVTFAWFHEEQDVRDGYVYFPALRFTLPQALKVLRTRPRDMLPLFGHYKNHSPEHEAMLNAYVSAMEFTFPGYKTFLRGFAQLAESGTENA